jgi:hypothetical protein
MPSFVVTPSSYDFGGKDAHVLCPTSLQSKYAVITQILPTAYLHLDYFLSIHHSLLPPTRSKTCHGIYKTRDCMVINCQWVDEALILIA